MAPLIRGKKFSEHGAGFMRGNGDCQAAGGARGNTFGGYKNKEAETIYGIHVQSDHLVVCASNVIQSLELNFL